jgi:2-amino-4-hydroxy-6-hydroxymethyldihydropteridine diphosphokinase
VGVIAYISLGSNLGKREQFLESARTELSRNPKILLEECSEIWNTEALDIVDQPDFLNQVVRIQTELSAWELLDFLQSVEKSLGRVHRFEKGPREIDLDILLFGKLSVRDPRLVIPHHSIESRPFIRKLLDQVWVCEPGKENAGIPK